MAILSYKPDNGDLQEDETPLPPPPAIASGSADESYEDDEEEEEAPKKKSFCRSKSTMCTMGILVICAIILGVTLSRPGALSAFGKKAPAASNNGDGTTYTPTFYPTYYPTMVPTGIPTSEDEKTTTTTTTTVAALGGNGTDNGGDGNGTTTTAATTTAITTTTTTTTEEKHPICRTPLSDNMKVLKVQAIAYNIDAEFTLTYPNATELTRTAATGDMIVGQLYREKICVGSGTYEFYWSGDGEVEVFLRGKSTLKAESELTTTLTVD